VDDVKQMERILAHKVDLPHLKAVIQTDGGFVKTNETQWRWQELESMNTDGVEEEYENRASDIAANECCSLVYTSGTVGLPKGVMLSHDNLIYDSAALVKHSKQISGSERFVSYLPLSHIAAQITELFVPLVIGGTVYFADRDVMKGTLTQTLRIARPTFLFGVPRVFEKIQEKLMAADAHQKLSLQEIKENLGLQQCRNIFAGAAPLSVATRKYFKSLDISILDGYGLSETSGPHYMSSEVTKNFDSPGIVLEGMKTLIDKPDKTGHGEICIKGRHVMMGYLDDKEKTREAFDHAGWFHTGDIGFIDDENYLHITGRLKELIITSGGENVPPTRIENLVKAECPAVSNSLLVGDNRKFLTLLVALKTEINSKGEPTDDLSAISIGWLKSLEVKYTKLSEVLTAGPDPRVLQAIQDAVDRVNLKAISNAQKVQKFSILPHDFSIPTGELGPSMKLKRHFVVEKYQEIIEQFYK
jgi:long-chain-fatty-acid--CoA ligase ACSBG